MMKETVYNALAFVKRYFWSFNIIILVTFTFLNASSAVLSSYTQQRYDAQELRWKKYTPMHMLAMVEVGKIMFSVVWLCCDIYFDIKRSAQLTNADIDDANGGHVSGAEKVPLRVTAETVAAAAATTTDGTARHAGSKMRRASDSASDAALEGGDRASRYGFKKFPWHLFFQQFVAQTTLFYLVPQQGLSAEEGAAVQTPNSAPAPAPAPPPQPPTLSPTPLKQQQHGDRGSDAVDAVVDCSQDGDVGVRVDVSEHDVDNKTAAPRRRSSHAANAVSVLHRVVAHVNTEAFLMSVPAVAYAVQNLFILDSQAKLDPVLFQMTFQARILMMAVAMRLIMKTPISQRRWVSLTMLSVGVIMGQLGAKQDRLAKTSLFLASSPQPSAAAAVKGGVSTRTAAVMAAGGDAITLVAQSRHHGGMANYGAGVSSFPGGHHWGVMGHYQHADAAGAFALSPARVVEALAGAVADRVDGLVTQPGNKDGDLTAAASVRFVSGMTSLFLGICLSVLSAVYMEAIFKKRAKKAFLSTRNIHLAFFSLVYFAILSIQEYYRMHTPEAEANNELQHEELRVKLRAANAAGQTGLALGVKELHYGTFHEYLADYLFGFDKLVWVMMFIKVNNGLVIAIIMRYSDNIMKTIATGAAIVISGIWAFLLFGTQITPLFFLGGVLVVVSVVLYNLWK